VAVDPETPRNLEANIIGATAQIKRLIAGATLEVVMVRLSF
jgi:hypothetical protein